MSPQSRVPQPGVETTALRELLKARARPHVMPSDCQLALRVGVMQRMEMDTKGVRYSNQYLFLTQDRLLISNSEDPEKLVFDDILLRDVIECELKEDEDAALDEEKMLQVIFRTMDAGYNAGRSYIYRSTYQDSMEWEVYYSLDIFSR